MLKRKYNADNSHECVETFQQIFGMNVLQIHDLDAETQRIFNYKNVDQLKYQMIQFMQQQPHFEICHLSVKFFLQRIREKLYTEYLIAQIQTNQITNLKINLKRYEQEQRPLHLKRILESIPQYKNTSITGLIMKGSPDYTVHFPSRDVNLTKYTWMARLQYLKMTYLVVNNSFLDMLIFIVRRNNNPLQKLKLYGLFLEHQFEQDYLPLVQSLVISIFESLYTKLQYLRLGFTAQLKSRYFINTQTVQSLVDLAAQMTQLKTLRFTDDIRFSESHAPYLIQVIQKIPQLQKIEAYDPFISDNALKNHLLPLITTTNIVKCSFATLNMNEVVLLLNNPKHRLKELTVKIIEISEDVGALRHAVTTLFELMMSKNNTQLQKFTLNEFVFKGLGGVVALRNAEKIFPLAQLVDNRALSLEKLKLPESILFSGDYILGNVKNALLLNDRMKKLEVSFIPTEFTTDIEYNIPKIIQAQSLKMRQENPQYARLPDEILHNILSAVKNIVCIINNLICFSCKITLKID